MRSTLQPTDTDAVTIRAGERDKERRLEIIVTLAGGTEEFRDFVFIKDRQSCKEFLDKLHETFHGIGIEERIKLRDALSQIRKENELDIDIHLPAKANGSCKIAIDYYAGSRKTWMTNGEAVNDAGRLALAEKVVGVHLGGKKTSPAKLQQLIRLVDQKLLEAIEKARRQSSMVPRPQIDAEKIPYEAIDGVGLVWHKPAQGGSIPQILTNFTARITSNIVRTDGVERSRDLEIEAALRGRPARRFLVKAAEFEKMKWPMAELGGEAIIEPEDGFDRRARVAIQKLSTEVQEKLLYTHTGWMESEGQWLYLHAGGIIAAANQPTARVDVSLGDALGRYELPAPPADPAWLKQCIRASLKILELGAPQIVYPLYCSIWRPLIGECELSTFLAGRTQSFKSELASLAVRHYGPAMHAKALPGSWDSTLNHLRDMAFKLKDSLFVVDDFKPGVLRARDAAELHKLADKLLRAQGNLSQRGRCDEYGNSRASKPPRGMILATGEELPFGQSLRARMWIMDISPTDIDPAALSACQKHAREGVYATAMAGAIQWLAGEGRIGTIRGEFRARLEAERPAAIEALKRMALSGDDLRRTTDNTLNLQLAFGHFLHFALASRAITDAEADKLLANSWAALVHSAELQARHQREEDPVARFFQLLRSAMSSGAAYLSGPKGYEPADEIKGSCGYRKRSSTWEPGRVRIGYCDEQCVGLDTETAFRVANEVVGPNGDGIGVSSPAALAKHLAAKGALLAGGDDRHGRRTDRKRIGGELRMVWRIAHESLNIVPENRGGVFCARTDENGGFNDEAASENLDFEPETRF